MNKISVVIASYNAQAFIEKAIKSVLDQSLTPHEIIIIDGGSKDDTVRIIKKYESKLAYWVSERDKGIYDAWNKGVEKVTGDWILFLGCDDILLNDTIEKYTDFIKSIPSDTEFISSRNQIVDENGAPIRVEGWEWEWPRFLNVMTVAHPGSLHSVELFKKYGNYNTNYKICGDYEFLLRPQQNLKAQYLNEISIVVAEGGASDSVAAVKEAYNASIITGGHSKAKAITNYGKIYILHLLKKRLRRVGLNLYLRK